MEILSRCPACNSERFEFNREITDYFKSGEVFSVQLCQTCGLLYTNPRPDKVSIGSYYQSEDYISHSNKKSGFFARLYQLARMRNLRWKFSVLSSYSAPGTILDIGCGTGEFLSYMQEQGWGVTGIEPDEGARSLAIENHGLDIRGEDYLNEISDASFRIISMWHVLEHVHDLEGRLRNVVRLLESGGYAFIALPNPASYDAGFYDSFWAGWDVPRHLYHFTPSAIRSFAGKAGLAHVDSLPMKFDAYYVSILSERYRKKSLSALRGILVGLLSNLAARKNAERYSSTLYIFRKQPNC